MRVLRWIAAAVVLAWLGLPWWWPRDPVPSLGEYLERMAREDAECEALLRSWP